MKKKLSTIILTTLLICNALFTGTKAQTTEPILQLNTEMHTAMINRISTDAKGKYLLTASKDKTAKLWDAISGDLLKTLRIPIGKGNEGMLNAVALSPDGRIAAVGGFSGKSGQDKNIYIFNTSTGNITQRLSGLDNVINDLEFSLDGKYLASALSGGKGVVIYKQNNSSANNFANVKTLSDYGSDSYNIAFDKSGRLATVCFDGKIRLYDNNFNLTNENTGAGKKPFSIAFSPDGNKIAVGYEDAPQIEVFSDSNLKLMYKPKLGSMNKDRGLNKLSFSKDGKYLYGGGVYSKNIDGNLWKVIRNWNNAGKRTYTDFLACGNSIMDIKALPNGDILFGGSQPDFGRMNSSGDKMYYKAGELNVFTNYQFKYFKINNSAEEITFTPSGQDALFFSVNDRIFTKSVAEFVEEKTLSELENYIKNLDYYATSEDRSEETLSKLESYTDSTGSLNITNWKNTYSPKLNNKTLNFFEQNERCRSVDVSQDANKIVFGADWNIYCTDGNGEKLWKTPVQGAAWAVNISGNGKVIAAAQSGGVINWYRMSDGKLLLTLYAHPDNKRWVLFTPGGYYDASPGAERLFGWHLNNGADKAAYFFPASKFRNKYHRTDVIDNILSTLDEGEAVRIANLASNRKANNTKIVNMLPPVVSIIKPYHNQEVSSETLTIEYSAKSPNGEPINNVKFMIDGRPVENQRGFLKLGNNQNERKTITIPKRDVKLQILAENQHGWSVPAVVPIKWKGQTVNQADILKPTLYVLSVGISDYKNNSLDLQYAAKDAKDFAACMQKQKGGLYKEVVIKTLTDAGATKNDILNGLDWIQRECTARDMAMIFIAGHGINDNVGTFYYLPYEADMNSIRRSCLMFTELKYTASSIAGKLVMYVDACHSGNVMGGRRDAPDVNSLVNELSDVESGAVVFTSSTGKQFSLEDASWSNGAFTEALLEGMNGKADLFNKGTITVKTLDAYIAQRVKELTNGKQSPTVVIPQSMPDFPIGVKR